MNYTECIENARPRLGKYCKACPECNGRACKNQMPGPGRLSVEDSGKPGADTIEGQKNLLLRFIENDPTLTLYGLFCDNGQTGTDFQRPEFEKLMEAVRRGEVDCIVVKDLSRFGRNYKETGNYLDRLSCIGDNFTGRFGNCAVCSCCFR